MWHIITARRASYGGAKDSCRLLRPLITRRAGRPITEDARWVSLTPAPLHMRANARLTFSLSFVEVSEATNGSLFFWHFQNRHIANRQRTVIWLNGGPGCSSEDGAMMEIGPYRMKNSQELMYNGGSWDEFANIMFVDNPVGTGFSFVDEHKYLHELGEMADQFVVFLEKWFEMFPHFAVDDVCHSSSLSQGLKLTLD